MQLLAVTVTTLDVWMFVAIGVLLVVLTFLALAEMSLSRMTVQRAEALREEGRRQADRLVRLTSDPTKWVNPLLLTVNILQTVQATLTGIVAGRLFGAPGVAVGVVLNVIVFFVLAEAVPKTYAILYSVRGALLTAPLVTVLSAFWPLRLASRGLIGITNVIVKGKGLEQGPFINEQEFLGMVEAAAKDSVIEHEERELIESVIEFGDTLVREVMVPRPDVVTIGEDFTIARALDVVAEQQLSRLPVLHSTDDGDDVLGIVYAKDLLLADREGRGTESIKGVMRTVHVIPETKPVNELMREMQRNKFHLAVVADEYGEFNGIVSLEDCLEELVGEIVDEHDYDEVDPLRELPSGDKLVSGAMSLDDVRERLDVIIVDEEHETIGGHVFGTLGRAPHIGDVVDAGTWRFVVEELDGRRIHTLRAIRLPDPEPLPTTSDAE